MSEGIGRTVGLRTAVCDYFLSMEKVFKQPIVVETKLLIQSERNALVDELTGLHNRRFFNIELNKEIERAKRQNKSVSLLIVDVDHFKRYNDAYGHPAGDKALQRTAKALKKNARIMDRVARYGGEEFVIILPTASKVQARNAAERHRSAIQRERFEHSPLTVSIGVATFPDDASHDLDLLSKADRALYMAKETGRNRVCVHADEMRKHQRFPMHLDAHLRDVDGSGFEYDGRTVNLSLSGMLYESETPLEVGKKIEAVLRFPDNGMELSLSGKSVHIYQEEEGKNVFYVGFAFDKSLKTETLEKLVSKSKETRN